MLTPHGGWRRVQNVAIFIALASPVFVATPASAAAGNLVTVRSAAFRTSDTIVGGYHNPNLSVDVVLSPRNPQEMSALAARLTDPRSPDYGRWLGRGQVNNLFGPSASARAAVTRYLRSTGLAVAPSSESPFWLRASGSSDAIAAAFHTTLQIYRSSRTGATYFANATDAQVPGMLGTSVRGVVGLQSTVRHHPFYKRSPFGARSRGTTSCEAQYPTVAQLVAAVTTGTQFPDGYGGAPGCNGLTPSQLTGIYGAPRVGRRGEGEGANVAVFELSAYQKSDIASYTKTFYGPSYHAPLVDIEVDGGPLAPMCPPGDTCPPEYNFLFR